MVELSHQEQSGNEMNYFGACSGSIPGGIRRSLFTCTQFLGKNNRLGNLCLSLTFLIAKLRI